MLYIGSPFTPTVKRHYDAPESPLSRLPHPATWIQEHHRHHTPQKGNEKHEITEDSFSTRHSEKVEWVQEEEQEQSHQGDQRPHDPARVDVDSHLHR